MDPGSPNPKRKPDRSATGPDPLITLRIPEEPASQIEEWCARYEGMDRSAALRILLHRGLQASAEIDRDMQQAAEPPWSDATSSGGPTSGTSSRRRRSPRRSRATCLA